MTDSNLQKIKNDAESLYATIGKVTCPYFKEDVVFNAKGIKHIKFKKNREARDRQDQYIRLKNIRFAPVIIAKSHTLQELRKETTLVETKTNSRREKKMKAVTYYGFVAIIKDGKHEKRFKIIVRQIEGGNKHFWSIIPQWKSNKELKIHSGNLAED